MMDNIGTLKELGVKPGDVVECVHNHMGFFKVWAHYTTSKNMEIGGYPVDQINASRFRLIPRAAKAPKLWRDMTPGEKGALLLAHHEGKVIEGYQNYPNGVGWLKKITARFLDNTAYRIKPEPVVKEVVQLMYCGADGSPYIATDMPNPTHRIVFKTIDGVPDCSSIKMEKVR